MRVNCARFLSDRMVFDHLLNKIPRLRTHNAKEEVMNVEQIDWKLDEEYRGTSRKLSELSAKAKQVDQRTAQLQQQVTEIEQQRIQVRASILLGEAVDSDASSLDKTLAHKRQELHNLEDEKMATAIALEKMQSALQQAETAAKKQVGQQLADVYRDLVADLEESLKVAIENNEKVQRVHRLASKQDLLAALAGDPAQKILLRNVAVNYLNGVALKEWRAAASHVLQFKTHIAMKAQIREDAHDYID
jgi:chromosome segregation ATPase